MYCGQCNRTLALAEERLVVEEGFAREIVAHKVTIEQQAQLIEKKHLQLRAAEIRWVTLLDKFTLYEGMQPRVVFDADAIIAVLRKHIEDNPKRATAKRVVSESMQSVPEPPK